MPFSNNSMMAIIAILNPYSMRITLFINISSILYTQNCVTFFIIDVSESVFNGLKFRLEQPVKLFSIGYFEIGLRENSKPVIDIFNFLTFSFENLFKKLMCGLRSLVVMSGKE
jgi:hypothetical protein